MGSTLNVQLRAFHAVATEGSFTKAARAIGVSQSTLSIEVKALEQRYGVQLFRRSGRAIELTLLGAELMTFTNRAFTAQAEAVELLQGTSRVPTGTLRLGADGPFHAMPLIAAFTTRHDGARVRMTVGNAQRVLADLVDIRLDVAVLARVPGDPRLYALPLWHDPVHVLLPRSHPMARMRTVPASLIAGERLVMREAGSMTRETVERAFAAVDLPLTPWMEVEGREASREAIAAGLGIGFMSAGELTPDPRLVSRPIGGCRVEMDEYVVCLRERQRLAIVRAFLDIAAEASRARREAAAPG
ncbi:LysR substrate-binding domain-containing protein [Inquilinus sp. OTU3971]|uniref:LysR substrate-binding domain-containing protein n=1 Tax=Inquilinus sp. OTU3971 TaxID=3043855 RepID=UPI00313F009C